MQAVDAAEVLQAAMRAGARWAELFIEERDAETLRLDDGRVAELRVDRDVGAAVRVFAGEVEGLAYTNRLTITSLSEAAQAAAAVARASRDPTTPTIDLTDVSVATVQRARTPAAQASAADKVELLRRADDAARSHHRSVNGVSATHVAINQHIVVASSDGRRARDHRVRTRLTCRVTATRHGRTESGFDGPGIGGGLELYEEAPPERIGVRAAERALRALAGYDPPTGVMSVVLGPGAGGLLLHEACGHGLEADGLSRKSSIFCLTAGQRVANRLITAVDDPSQSGGFGSYGIDDEGRPSARAVLIDQGVQVGAITDSRTAVSLGVAPTANARRATYADPPLPRMSNTYIEAGADDPAGMLAAIRRGVFVTRLRGGDVNVATGEFAFTAAEAYLIEGGRLTRPLNGVTLLGNGPAALAAIEGVGPDLTFTQALCGKDGQWIPVSFGAPTLTIGRLTIAGPG